MCGLVGIVSKRQLGFSTTDGGKFNQMLLCDAVRGLDSTGVFGVNKHGNVDYLKSKGNPFVLMHSKEYEVFNKAIWQDYQMVIGHNRKATVGTINDENAHPFVEEHIILVHNGSLNEHKNLTDADVDVDSHAICHAIKEKGYKQALKEINGAFALIWFDAKDKCLRFVRNDKRPLHLLETDDNFYLASENGMAEWIITREVTPWKHKKWTTEEIDTGTVYTIDLQTRTLEKEKVDLYKPPPVVTQLPRIYNVHTGGTTAKKSGGAGSFPVYTCAKGDMIAVNVDSYTELPGNSLNKDNPIVAILSGRRIFPGQPDVRVYVTANQYEAYLESDTHTMWCKVQEQTTLGNGDQVIYCRGRVEEYHPEYDVTGTEVFLEEWKLANSHKCKKCGNEVYWKDINLTRFKFRTEKSHRIVCKSCVGDNHK